VFPPVELSVISLSCTHCFWLVSGSFGHCSTTNPSNWDFTVHAFKILVHFNVNEKIQVLVFAENTQSRFYGGFCVNRHSQKNASTEENKMASSFFEFFCVYGLFGRTHVAISSGSVT